MAVKNNNNSIINNLVAEVNEASNDFQKKL